MAKARELIEQLNCLDESVDIEAKRGSEAGKSVMETICAFANEPDLGGGYIILGLDAKMVDGEIFYTPAGVSQPDKIQLEIANKSRDQFNIALRPEITVEDVDGAAIVIVRVKEVSAAQKPVYFKKRGLPEGAYRRIGPADHKCTEDDLLVLYSERKTETYDSSEITDASLEDFDKASIDIYRNLRRQANPDAEELEWSDGDLLYALGCIARKETELPTVAGLLLFGNSLALRRYFPMMRIDYIRVEGKQWIENPDSRFETIEIRRPLIEAVRRVQAYIVEDLPKTFSLPENAIQSTQEPILPLRVIREAVVNAVMHRNYRIHGAIQVIRYSNRIEIRNPGHSLKAEEQLGQPGSQARNPLIAAVFHDLNIAETKGSGIRVMRKLMNDNNLMPPAFESTRHPEQFVATLLFHHLLDEGDIKWLGSFGESFNDEEAKALVFVREIGALNNSAYREINKTDTLSASNSLRRLRAIGLLIKKGAGNRTYYIPSEKFTQSVKKHKDTHRVEENTHRAEAYTHKPETNTHKAEAYTHKPESLLPDDLLSRLPAKNERPRKPLIKSLILEICSYGEFSTAELAVLLKRKDKISLAREYLTPLVSQKRLRYTIPQMPNHPNQKYTTV